MYTKKNNSKTWLGAVFSIALVAIIGLTFAFKPFNKSRIVDDKRTTYFFKYNGAPGFEATKELWTLTDEDEPGCSGQNDGCLIEVNASYTTETGSSRILNANVPVASGEHKNPIIGPMVVSASYKTP